ncbi:MAG TPA: hypothetical protein VFK97_03005 [Candidatus Saccharimonadales bacterium]|nr:hypothetical protein [Candidatus Saccharimonadales bacterium]
MRARAINMLDHGWSLASVLVFIAERLPKSVRLNRLEIDDVISNIDAERQARHLTGEESLDKFFEVAASF